MSEIDFSLVQSVFSSHLVSIPAGTSLSDALRKSPIIDGGDGGAASAGGFDMDADAAADPELAMALRISLEEQRARQQQSGADNNETKEDNNQAQPMDQDQQMLQGYFLQSQFQHININFRCTTDEYGRWCRSHGWWSINGRR